MQRIINPPPIYHYRYAEPDIYSKVASWNGRISWFKTPRRYKYAKMHAPAWIRRGSPLFFHAALNEALF
jgi:hypothetical protein